MENVPDTSFWKFGVFIDVSDYKENMAIRFQKYCFAMGLWSGIWWTSESFNPWHTFMTTFVITLWGNMWKCLTNYAVDSYIGVFESIFASVVCLCLYNLSTWFKVSPRLQACRGWSIASVLISEACYFISLNSSSANCTW